MRNSTRMDIRGAVVSISVNQLTAEHFDLLLVDP